MSLSADARPPSLVLVELGQGELEASAEKERKETRKRKRTRSPKAYNAALTALHDLRDHLFADGRGDRQEENADNTESQAEESFRKEKTEIDTETRPARRRLRYRAAVSDSVTEIEPTMAFASASPSASSATSPTGLPPSLSAMDPPVLSFYGAEPVPLPSRFAQIKRSLAHGHHAELKASWVRLLEALEKEVEHIQEQGAALIPSIEFADIGGSGVDDFKKRLQACGVGVIRGVVSPSEAAEWVAETQQYLEPEQSASASTSASTTTIKPPPPQDPTCFDYFWTPAQVRSRAHPNVLKAMQFAMGFWGPSQEKGETEKEEPRLSTRFPITYADRIRIHVDAEKKQNPSHTKETLMAQVDGGSLERWEPDGYGRAGTYDCIFRGRWEEYDPWDPAGRVNATPDLYNGAGACSIFRMFQGLLALTDVAPGVVRLLPSPKLATAYFLLRPLFKAADEDQEEEWKIDDSTIIHGAVPGHAQRVTELWHPHLQLDKSLVALPRLEPGDYIVWHCDTAYTIGTESERQLSVDGEPATPTTTPMIVYLPACPLTQTNALYLARQRKAFQRGHPGPDFDSTGTGLGSEAEHGARLGEEAIGRWGPGGLRGMGLSPWPTQSKTTKPAAEREVAMKDSIEDKISTEKEETSTTENPAKRKAETDASPRTRSKTATAAIRTATKTAPTKPVESTKSLDKDHESDTDLTTPLSQTELEVVRLANIILFPDQYEFYMPTRHNSPDR